MHALGTPNESVNTIHSSRLIEKSEIFFQKLSAEPLNLTDFLISTKKYAKSIKQNLFKVDVSIIISDQQKLNEVISSLDQDPKKTYLLEFAHFINCYVALRQMRENCSMMINDPLKAQAVTESCRIFIGSIKFFIMNDKLTLQKKLTNLLNDTYADPNLKEILRTSNLTCLRIINACLSLYTLPEGIISHPGFHKKAFFSGIETMWKSFENKQFMESAEFEHTLSGFVRFYAKQRLKDLPSKHLLLRKSSVPDIYEEGKLVAITIAVSSIYEKEIRHDLFLYYVEEKKWIFTDNDTEEAHDNIMSYFDYDWSLVQENIDETISIANKYKLKVMRFISN